MQLKPEQSLLVQGGLGRYHRVTAIFLDLESTNAYLASSPQEGVLAVFAGVIFVADNDDLGLSVPVHSSQES